MAEFRIVVVAVRMACQMHFFHWHYVRVLYSAPFCSSSSHSIHLHHYFQVDKVATHHPRGEEGAIFLLFYGMGPISAEWGRPKTELYLTTANQQQNRSSCS